MSDTAGDEKRIRDDAAAWYAKLNHTTVSTDTLRAFREWRRDARHDLAYVEIDAFWQRSARLRNDPEIQQAAGAALAREPKLMGPLPRPGGRTLAAAVLVLLVAVAAVPVWSRLMGQAYGTAVGEQRFVTLADGSRLRLDTDSKVRVRLQGPERRVDLLRGRAYFEVAHDVAHPFIVRAGTTEVRALGTRFDVRRDAADVAVTLLEGKVRVDGPAQGRDDAWTLGPGQQVVVASTGPAPQVRAVDAGLATSWTTGRLIFRGRPLSDAIAEVNRYSPTRVVLDAPALSARPVTGAFDAGDTSAFVAAISDLFDLKARTEGREIILRPTT